MACVGRVAPSEKDRRYEIRGAERDRDRTVTQDTQQRGSRERERECEIKKRRTKVSEEGVYVPPLRLG